jgi:hypothetical protein
MRGASQIGLVEPPLIRSVAAALGSSADDEALWAIKLEAHYPFAIRAH